MMRERKNSMSGKMKKVAMAVLGVMFSVLLYMGSTNVVKAENTVTLNTADYEYAIAEFTDVSVVKGYLENHTVLEADEEGYLFAGWYTDTACTKTNAVRSSNDVVDGKPYYAKFVPEEVLNVKAQISTEDTDSTDNIHTRNMRFVSSVDSLNYNRVGLMLQYEDAEGNTVTRYNTSQTVYERIVTATAKDDYEFSPKVVDTDSEYFITATWKDITDFDLGFYVRAYWKTFDGTVVYGPSRYVSVNDGLDTSIVNLAIKDTNSSLPVTTEGAEPYTVTYKDNAGSEKTVTATVAYHDGTYAHARIELTPGATEGEEVADVDREAELSSVTTFTVGNLPAKYRNLYTSYDSNEDTPDTSWYTAYSSDNESDYVIATSADLYGLADLINVGIDGTKQTMSGKNIYVVSDIAVNTIELDPSEYADETAWNSAIANVIEWTPMGHNTTSTTWTMDGTFSGNFDAQGHTISGIYISETQDSGVGFFGVTDTGSMVQNLRLTNSYITSANVYRTGSVVGMMKGHMNTVYSDAIVAEGASTTALQQMGGLVGIVYNDTSSASEAVNVENCWFAGRVEANAIADIGGISGSVRRGSKANVPINFKNCMFTGKISHSKDNGTTDINIGGILGRDNASSCKVTIEKCLSTGTITATGDFVGSVLGKPRAGSYSLKDCFATNGIQVCGVGSDSETVVVPTYTVNSEIKTADDLQIEKTAITGYVAYTEENVKNLGYYTYNNQDAAWIVTEHGTPELKSFSNDGIDVAWYYDKTYVLHTPEELYGFSALSQKLNFSGITVSLADDIKMNAGNAELWYEGTSTPKRAFTPIGKGKSFSGIFDGNNKTVSGVYVYDDVTPTNNIGFFAQTTGTLQNFRLENSYIVNPKSKNATGGVVGKLNNGNLSNVYCDAIVESAGGSYTAGMAGVYDATADEQKQISNCWFEGAVHTKGRWAGGIVGRVNTGTLSIENCISNGDISSSSTNSNGANAGGIIGSVTADETSSAVIKNCLVMSDVTAQSNVGSVVGGINQIVRFENVYTSKSVGEAITGVGKIIDNTIVDESVTGEPILLDINELTGENAYIYTDYDFENVWGVVSDGTPVLRSLYDGTVETDLTAQRISTNWYYNNTQYDSSLADSTSTFTIRNTDDLFGLARLVNNGNGFSGKFVELVENGSFDLSSDDFKVTINEDGTATTEGTSNPWTPIGTSAEYAFKGTFDGNNNTICGVYVNNGSDNTGFFGLTSGATLQDFRLENSYIGMSTTKNYVGGIVGRATNSSLMNIYCNAAVIATKGTHQGVGGLAGIFEAPDGNGTISNCWFEGTVNTKGRQVGGVVGRVYQNGKDSANGGQLLIQDCISNGIVKSTYKHADGTYLCNIGGIAGAISVDNTVNDMSIEIINCLSLSEIISSDETGGTVVGNLAENTMFENVYTTGTIEGNVIDGVWINNGAIIEGQPVVLSQTALTDEDAYIYTELDFQNIWGVVKNDTPVLRSLYDGTIEENLSADRISTGWYYNSAYYNASTVDSTVDYSISTADDLRGLAKLVNDGTETFAAATLTEGESTIEREQRTITLTDDITLNEGKATDWAASESGRPTTSWTPIGNATNKFAGKFDAGKNEISGIFISTDKQYAGLFGYVSGAIVKDLRLVNSYMEYTNDADAANLGSVVAFVENGGEMSGVYSDAILDSKQVKVGGLISGLSVTSAACDFNITNCWYDGTIRVQYKGDEQFRVGGLIGGTYKNNTVMDGCLYTGTINCESIRTSEAAQYNNLYIGGLYGRDVGSGSVEIKNSLSAGEISTTWKENAEHTSAQPISIGYVNTIIGYTNNASMTATENVYSTTKITKKVLDADPTTSTSAVVSRGGSALEINFEIDTAWAGNEENILGYGSRLLTTLPYTETEGTALWLSRANNLPIPAVLEDVVSDELPYVFGRADTSWYYGHEDDASYTLYDIEDLYGFSVVATKYDFAGKTVYLVNDIKVNDSERVDSTWVASDWAEKDVSALLPWQQIGINLDGQRFAGTFDGNGNSISGLYMKQDINRMGLFGPTECGSLVKDVRLENSYFEQTGSGILGSIVAECRGAISGVYSDAILVSESNEVGGIVARANGYNYETDGDDETESGFTDKRVSSYIKDCWFDGTIKQGDARYAGGIAAQTRQGAWIMENCLFTGTIENQYDGSGSVYVGGLCGEVKAQSTSDTSGSKIPTSLDIQSCVSTGTVTCINQENGVGSVVGRVMAEVGLSYDESENTVVDYRLTSLNMTNVFVSREAGSRTVYANSAASATDDKGVKYTSEKPSVTGYATQVNNADRLIGYCEEESFADGTSTYAAATLGFDAESPAWVIRDMGVPVPIVFKDMVNAIEDPATLDDELGLEYWDSYASDSDVSLAEAVDYGVGNYVLTFEDTDLDAYKGYLTKLKDELQFKAYVDVDFDNPVGTAADGVYNVIYKHSTESGDVDWVLNVLHVANTRETKIIICNDESMLSDALIASSTETGTDEASGNVTMAMLQLKGSKGSYLTYTQYYGNSYVFQLPNGHFIINDGGSVIGDDDFNGLMSYLTELAGTKITKDEETNEIISVENPVYIDAWTVSHQHGDHLGVVRKFLAYPEYAKYIFVEAFYINEPNNKAIHIEDQFEDASATLFYSEAEMQYQGIRMLTKKDGKTIPDIYRYQTGQRYYFNGLTMDVIQSQEMIPVSSYGKRNAYNAKATDYNTASTVLLFTIGEGTDAEKKVFIGGDMNYVNMQTIMDMYGTDENGYTKSSLLENINVYTVPHHGKNTSSDINTVNNAFTNYLRNKTSNKFDVVLFPCSLIYGVEYLDSGAFPTAKAANQHLISCAKDKQYYHYGEGNVILTFGDTITVNAPYSN